MGYLFRALRRWETLKSEANTIEQAGQHIFHRTGVATISNPTGNEANPTDVAQPSTIKRRTGGTGEDNTYIMPLVRVLPERLLERTREQQTRRLHSRKRTDLKLAFSEFYLMLVLLQNYQTLNSTGFRKILKKHDKLFQTTRGEEWR